MEPASNGVMISWDEIRPPSSKNTFDNREYKNCKEVFELDDSDDGLEKAFARFKELWVKYYQDSKLKMSSEIKD